MGHYDSCYADEELKVEKFMAKVRKNRMKFLTDIGFTKAQAQYLYKLEEELEVAQKFSGLMM